MLANSQGDGSDEHNPSSKPGATVETSTRPQEAQRPDINHDYLQLAYPATNHFVNQPIQPKDQSELEAISDSRRILMQEFEDNVIRKFADFLSTQGKSVVKVAGSMHDEDRLVRPASDIDLLVLSPAMKDANTYVDALFHLNKLARDFYQERNNQQNEQDHAFPTFFTKLATEHDRINLARLTHQVEKQRIIPCHFLFYRNEAELQAREGKLGERLLEESAFVIDGGPSNTDELTGPKPGQYDKWIWELEQALADYILNSGFSDASDLNERFANVIHSTVRSFADELPLPSDKRNAIGVLRYFDEKNDNGGPHLEETFRQVEYIREGSRTDTDQLQALIVPAILILEQLKTANSEI